MKFSIEQHEAKYFSLGALPGPYDAVPLLGDIRVDATSQALHPDRAAAALCLLFHDSVSGGFELDEPGCSPHTAAAIEGFFRPTNCNVFPVDYKPSRVVVGDAELSIVAPGAGLPDIKLDEPTGVCIRLEGEVVGMIASWDGITVSTNAMLMRRENASRLQAVLPAVGIALLFCEDLLVGRINLPRSLIAVDARSEHELAEKVRRLLDSVGLRLRWV